MEKKRSKVLFSIISRPLTLPLGEGQQLLKTFRNSGLIFFQHANILLNPYVMEFPTDIIK